MKEKIKSRKKKKRTLLKKTTEHVNISRGRPRIMFDSFLANPKIARKLRSFFVSLLIVVRSCSTNKENLSAYA